YFGETFVEMFRGGKASIELEDPADPLNCGIEPALHGSIFFGKKQLRSLSLPKKNPSVDFSWDCRIAAQFCMLLTRPPWLNIFWQETITLPEPVEGNSVLDAYR
ncbi:MAG: hypothetical protein II110_09650, partial [Treponema sp.]|nr:hypothetical protein [Treponema sp.]